MITIQNESFTASIRLKGAELASFRNKATAREMIWQADPHIWGGSAPILFPIVGFLHNDETIINGCRYAIPKHGVLRNRMATVVHQGHDRVVFRFESDAESLELYPFPFTFDVSFRLTGKGLAVDYNIINCGPNEMLFSVGSHPAFALDLERNELSDYFIQFSEPETLDLFGLENNLLVKRQERYLKEEDTIHLSKALFDRDALIFQDIRSRTIRLKCRKAPHYIEMDIREAPHLGIWARPGAAFVCIEPWYTFNDAANSDGLFRNKPGIMSRPAGDCFETGYTILPYN